MVQYADWRGVHRLRLKHAGTGLQATEIPAIRFRPSRYCDTIETGVLLKQEWQIVQSCMNLRDLLPRFASQVFRIPRV